MIVARLATYLQIPGYGEALVQVNNWDMDTLATFRSSNVVKTMGGAIDSVADMTQLQEIDKLIPEEWRPAAVERRQNLRPTLGGSIHCWRRRPDYSRQYPRTICAGAGRV
ncbi:MAG: hypothetical protein CM15mP120_20600 [Pseudomonadota bacterium]|nr:MAG: hypothetical protein CM15mP120_20600 [Pseudomonadota bacterium]